MKASVIVSIFPALAVGANVCDLYDKCYCTNSDGTPASDDIQTQACLQYGADNRGSDTPGPGNMTATLEDNIVKCVGNVVEAGNVFHLDNCEYAKECAAKGASGTPICEGIYYLTPGW
ncbi:hypothetical protein CGRA01v4_00501 [Colletotrichum graminicola]|uniref:Uncharacterized protein n=1 Tax=Colletotrichum graminicola (strain M1.001 / M2 / FGSC 10212) TaxID=645133 RepID=E3QQ80_COLGM|nr:uncharacterized protein GLRG_08162 [Colletotrichum graminicola M1.001]EFQ33018.1 hypothetical protein GLRG_08162 [Colletotrichum graminicola M1.001]WDK09223.1 hypothetical protein CGRA01v4_00501 [Colletotrichum graminicola]